ncbi:MAG: ABC transporter permease [Clostridiales bacterium]|jgi:ABC-2 type transport system permease protein|nr:ABC transporter permease [Eubacteriales bacterium]MDH7567241.1 ABC transporter permease [Clostridiales bacterium]
MAFFKELKTEIVNTFKNRDVIILLLLGPVALTLLFGGIYLNSYVEDIPIAVLDEDNSSTSRMIVQQFDENDRFVLKYTVDSQEELKNLLDSKKIHMGICIPPHFERDINKGQSSQVLILVDGTNMVVGNNSYAAASTIIQTVSAGAEIKILEGGGMVPRDAENVVNAFTFTDRTLYDPRMTYMNYLLLGYIAVFFQQVMLSGVGISIIKDGSPIAREATLRKIFLKILSCAFFALVSVYGAILIAAGIFRVPIRGSILLSLAFCGIFAPAISCPAIMIASLAKDKLKFAQISFMLSLPTFVSCGYVWPQDQMPWILGTLIKLIWPLIYFARPLDELLFKGSLPVRSALGLVLYTLVWMPAAIFMFKRSFKDGAGLENHNFPMLQERQI